MSFVAGMFSSFGFVVFCFSHEARLKRSRVTAIDNQANGLSEISGLISYFFFNSFEMKW